MPNGAGAMTTVCLDCRYISNRPSGIGTVVQALVDFLPSLAPDWKFRFLRNPLAPQPLSQAANVTEVEVPAATNGPASLWFLPWLVDFDGVDLFHAPSNILPRGLRSKRVTTIHDTMWLTAPQLCNAGLWGQVERRFYRVGMQRALAQSDAIVTVSEATRQAVLHIDPRLADRTIACLPGTPPAFSPREPDPTILARLGLTPGRFVLIIGQNAPYKNHAGAVRGFATAFGIDAGIDLVLVRRQGAGSHEIDRLAQSLGIAGRVRVLPPQDEVSLAELYRGALALLHPSLCEGFGLPLLEAMACGCPVVTSDRSAMPEVTGGAALLVDPEDPRSIGAALRRIASEPGLAAVTSARGLQRAQELDRRSFALANLEVYRRVLGAS